MNEEEIKRGMEAILFVWGSPVEAAAAAGVFGISESDAVRLFDEIAQEYEDRGGGLMIRRISGSYQLCTRPECEDPVRRFCMPVRTKKLSNAALEVLAVIAYRQPVSRIQIDEIRGVKSERVIDSLQKKGLIEERGRGNGIGRPILYGTTRFFLEKFGIESLDALPDIEEENTCKEEQQITLDV